MMKSFVQIALATLLACSVALSSSQEKQVDAAAKGNVRYSMRPDYTRFLVFFKGPLRYTRDLKGKTLTLTISGIKSSVTQSGWAKKFRSGEIENASVEPVLNGNSRVILTLRDGAARFQITEHDRHEAIWVDVFTKGGAATVSAAASSANGKQARVAPPIQKPVMKAPVRIASRQVQDQSSQRDRSQVTSIIDIGAIARQQLEESNGSANGVGQNTQSRAATLQVAPADSKTSGSGKRPMLWLLLACASLLISVVVVALLVRRVTKRTKKMLEFLSVRAAAMASSASESNEMVRTEIPGQSGHRRREVDSTDERDDELSEESSPALELAAQYSRNRGDVELAMKLRESTRHQIHLGGAKTISPVKLPTKSRVSTAKKLGVGNGEIDLAAKLLRLSMAHSEKEEAE